MKRGAIIVIDLGKTLSKVSLWSREGEMLDRQLRPTTACTVGGLTRLDADGIGSWLISALARYGSHPVETIVPVGHGAAVAAIDGEHLAFAPLDYEQALPSDVMAEYRSVRDPFTLTGSPALPDGLNVGAQLFWLEQIYPAEMRRSVLLPWAQYWAWFLTGRLVSEVTSLGCHSDLWCPASQEFSPLAKRLGWADRFAPIVKAGDVVGTLSASIVEATGLPASTRVLAGLHDSNAALLAARGFSEISRNEATVLSTGTWFIAMRLPAEPVDLTQLPEACDCLVNVDAYGQPVPSARFMGGREIETVIGIDTRRVDIKPDQPALLGAVPDILANMAMLLPTLAPGCGPFPFRQGRWLEEPDDWYARRAAMCLYAALVADTALNMIGSRGRLLVEGRFAEAEVFVRALAALRPETEVFTANAHNDVSFGALRLVNPQLIPQGRLARVKPLPDDLSAYRTSWHAQIEASL